MPFLAYLEDEKSLKDSKSLGYVFSVIDQELNDLLQKLDEPKTDMGFLLSFAPIVEGVLSESPEYCLEAEAERVKSERRESFQQKLFFRGCCFSGSSLYVNRSYRDVPLYFRGVWGWYCGA